MRESEIAPQKDDQSCWQKYIFIAWKPYPSASSSVTLYLGIGILCLIIGIIYASLNRSIFELKDPFTDYQKICNLNENCEVSFTLDEEVDAPIYLLYQLSNFYQNNRRYLNSRSTKQLSGSEIDENEAVYNCKPIIYNRDLEEFGITTGWGGEDLDGDEIANPCGLAAKAVFTDQYALFKCDGDFDAETCDRITINEDAAPWPQDVGTKFKRLDGDETESKKKQWMDPEDPHFIVWMRAAGLQNFKKIWGKIESPLLAGDYYMVIGNYYDSDGYEGTKNLILSTVSALGGKNDFITIIYFVCAVICFGIAIFFFLKGKSNASYGKKKLI